MKKIIATVISIAIGIMEFLYFFTITKEFYFGVETSKPLIFSIIAAIIGISIFLIEANFSEISVFSLKLKIIYIILAFLTYIIGTLAMYLILYLVAPSKSALSIAIALSLVIYLPILMGHIYKALLNSK